MNYATIKYNDIANGPGVRVSVFVSGCRHRCKNCFNSEAWDFNYGSEFNISVIESILQKSKPDYVSGLSLLGGEPFEPENRQGLIELCREFKKQNPHKTVWCYTGFVFEDIIAKKLNQPDSALSLLKEIDVLVDGKFIESKKSLSLIFRGSSNQRILDVKKSLEKNEPIWLEGEWEHKF